jgi:hypothetical protein
MPTNQGPLRQGIPAGRPTQDPPEFDAAASRERQMREHGKVVDGKKDGNPVGPKPVFEAEHVKTSGPGR